MSLTSIPANVAASVRAKARPGLDLSVRQPRKPEWLAQNVDNPFRRWDGAGHITAARYRQARAAALKSPTVAALTAMATAHVEGVQQARRPVALHRHRRMRAGRHGRPRRDPRRRDRVRDF